MHVHAGIVSKHWQSHEYATPSCDYVICMFIQALSASTGNNMNMPLLHVICMFIQAILKWRGHWHVGGGGGGGGAR